jgi:hypothetical protein
VRDGRAEFVFVSLWESFDAIRAFARPDPGRAVYYPEDRAFLLEMRPGVEHLEVVEAPPAAGGPSAGPDRGHDTRSAASCRSEVAPSQSS